MGLHIWQLMLSYISFLACRLDICSADQERKWKTEREYICVCVCVCVCVFVCASVRERGQKRYEGNESVLLFLRKCCTAVPLCSPFSLAGSILHFGNFALMCKSAKLFREWSPGRWSARRTQIVYSAQQTLKGMMWSDMITCVRCGTSVLNRRIVKIRFV